MLSTKTVMPIGQKQADLNQELRDYSESIDQSTHTFSIEELKASLVGELSEYWIEDASSEMILANMGIAHIFKTSERLGSKYIVCSITDDREEAETLLQKLSQPIFSELRQKLNILSHWIFLCHSGYLFLCSRNEFTDWAGNFRCVDYPECWIVDELHNEP